MSNSPFVTQSSVARFLKIALIGEAKSGKTRAGLTFPDKVIIDTEHGTDLYSGLPEYGDLRVLHSASYKDIMKALDWVAANIQKEGIKTLMFDSATPVREGLQALELEMLQRKAAAKGGNVDDVQLGMREFGRVNQKMKALYAKLSSLRCNVVVTARQTDLMEGSGDYAKKIGIKADVDKSFVYMFDFLVWFNKDGSARIEGRGKLKTNEPKKVEYALFADLAQRLAKGQEVSVETEVEAVQRELDDLTDKDNASLFHAEMKKLGVTIGADNIRDILGVSRLTEFKQGAKEARKMVEAWIAKRGAAPVQEEVEEDASEG